ncbi:MAG TPA: FtsQ-type POTRA domain-containing protein [Amycolatopsis sp.]|uniref:cell division protein FtsQ/DivIB n=1 Tax=Amycolatopsis sp. TaxID=37632 RepID=UPI002B493FB6|nr:FtsQ-type POTRA domain-containing protein [Amycolatopsis sp.]HKS43897.1 FtsQ-type POTRA domain-containing protein [Amycolatopsis sp.]
MRRGTTRPARGRRPETTRRPPEPNRNTFLRRRRVALLTVLTVVGLGYVLFFTSFLGVSAVEVTGASTIPAEEIRAAAAVPEGLPMLLVDTGEIAAKVDRLAGVASVDVSRSWPSTVEITVVERNPVGFFAAQGAFHLVDATGFDYKKVQGRPAGLPELTLARPAPDDPVTRSVVAVLTSLPRELVSQITAVRAQTPGGVEFTLRNGKIVRWGDAGQPDRKAKVLAVLLTRQGHVYDVASPELPTVS